LIVEAPVSEELRVLVDGELYLSELHHVRDGLVGRANTPIPRTSGSRLARGAPVAIVNV
jgi:hypothetical protein